MDIELNTAAVEQNTGEGFIQHDDAERNDHGWHAEEDIKQSLKHGKKNTDGHGDQHQAEHAGVPLNRQIAADDAAKHHDGPGCKIPPAAAERHGNGKGDDRREHTLAENIAEGIL